MDLHLLNVYHVDETRTKANKTELILRHSDNQATQVTETKTNKQTIKLVLKGSMSVYALLSAWNCQGVAVLPEERSGKINFG